MASKPAPAASQNSSVKLSAAQYGSDVIVDLIKALGFEYCVFNPGESFHPIHDSLVNYGGNAHPEVIAVTHEEIGVAMAHGYAKATGKPMLTITHNIVGLLHASMAIFNAWCDRVPVMVMGGTGPMDTTTRAPWIQWLHTALVQGNLVRDFVKWDDQPASLAGVPESLIRAYQVATSDPMAPVYVNIDATIQHEKLAEPYPLPNVERYAQPTRLQADYGALAQIADWLIAAESPVILVDFLGRHPESVPLLVELAELVACPVVDKAGRMNFPSNHPLDVTGADYDYLSQADFILALDVNDLYGHLTRRIPDSRSFMPMVRDDAKVARLGLGDLLIRSLSNDFQRIPQSDIAALCDTSLALPSLIELCKQRLGNDAGTQGRIESRAKATAKRHEQLRRQFRDTARSMSGESPIDRGYLLTELGAVLENESWMLVNGVATQPRRLWDCVEPNCFLGWSGGGGLGYGLGAALGASLGLRDTGKIAVSIQSDGDFLYTPSALWTAAHHEIPVLTVMYNNRSYYNSEAHARSIAVERNQPLENAPIATQLRAPDFDFGAEARLYGLWGEGPIEDPAEIRPALERALKVVKEEGRYALVDIICSNPPPPRQSAAVLELRSPEPEPLSEW